jgi:acetolactate synthase-1/2/3 large subunit
LKPKTTWHAIVDILATEGVHHLFGLPGNPRQLYEALLDHPEITPVLVREESSGGFMAYAYARATTGPAVCFGSPGPGVANLVPAILEAQAACLPVIALGAAAPQRDFGRGAFQECDQLGMMHPITKWAWRITSPEGAPWAMRRAFHLATSGQPGPVYVEVPSDVGLAQAEMPPYRPVSRNLRSAGSERAVIAAADSLCQAQRPLLLVGGGGYLSGAQDEVRTLVEEWRLPVATTPGGRGVIPEDHALALGLTGLYFNEVAAEAFGQTDLVLALGSRLEQFQTSEWTILPEGARLVQVDAEPFEIGRNYVPDVPVIGDVRLVLRQLLSSLQQRLSPDSLPWSEWSSSLARRNAAYLLEVAAECRTEEMPLRTKRVAWEIGEVFGPETILVNENGSQDLWTYYVPYYRVREGGLCVPPGEQTCLGLGVAGAIGAKLAHPGKHVVCVTGDGAFQTEMKELPTAVQHDAPVTWVVLDNRSLGWPKLHERLGGWQRSIAVDFEAQPDFAAVAQASGCYGERVDVPAQITPALRRALEANLSGQPAVLHFIVDDTEFGPGFRAQYGL